MSGFTCKDCNRFIPHGATHTPLPMTKECRTVTERGVECMHDWANADSAATLYGTQPTPTVPAGQTCAKCLQTVEPCSTHRVFVAEKMCTTVPAGGHLITHFWPSATTTHTRKTYEKHPAGNLVGQRVVKPSVPHRHSRSVLENAARELAGVNGHLESYRHHEDEEYVTVELIVRKDRA